MELAAQNRMTQKACFLNGSDCGLVQAIPIDAEHCLVAQVQEFTEFKYSFEGPVPFSGDPRLAFNRIPETGYSISRDGFKVIGREFNRIARLSGTDAPGVVETFRSQLISGGELLTFVVPVYRDAGHAASIDAMDAFRPPRHVPSRTCLAVIEVRCRRDYDYMPSRSTHFFFYHRDKLRIAQHVVHVGPQHDCPGEEWEAKAYEGMLECGIHGFFAHNDGAVSIELRTQPRGLLGSVLPECCTSCGEAGDFAIEFGPVMRPNHEAVYRFSPAEIPDRSDRGHLQEFRRVLDELHTAVSRAVGGLRDSA